MDIDAFRSRLIPIQLLGVPPKLTFLDFGMMVSFGRPIRLCLVVSLALIANSANAQNRTWVGAVGSTVSKADQIKPMRSAVKVPARPDPATKTQIDVSPAKKSTTLHKARASATSEQRGDSAESNGSVKPDNPNAAAAASANDEALWRDIQATLRPSRLIALCEQFERELPESRLAPRVRSVAKSARQAIEIQRSAGLSGDFFEDLVGDDSYRENLRLSVRGDADAAHGIALAYKTGSSGVDASPRRMEQWLRFSAELGSGPASWQLAEIYNRNGRVADAARFEKRAVDLGYQPPPRLPTRGY